MTLDSTIRESRRGYVRKTLDRDELAADPIAQFRVWLDEAVADDQIVEANAVNVATVDADGTPSSRIVLLRGIDDRGFVFFTNYESRKGRALDASRRAALLFYWDRHEREVRIEGDVERLDTAESDAYFADRPVGHRLSAWASPQSEVIASREVLEARTNEFRERFGEDVPRPPFWGGYRVRPRAIEFWQGRRDRLHDRFVYLRDGESWRIDRLAP